MERSDFPVTDEELQMLKAIEAELDDVFDLLDMDETPEERRQRLKVLPGGGDRK